MNFNKANLDNRYISETLVNSHKADSCPTKFMFELKQGLVKQQEVT